MEDPLVLLINQLIDKRLKVLCETCRVKAKRSKLTTHNFSISIPPSAPKNLSFDLDFSRENKENVTNRNNKPKPSRSQALALDPALFTADISAIAPLSLAQSPVQKKRKGSYQYKSLAQSKKEQQTTYEKILKVKR